jgi:hypothetical protein
MVAAALTATAFNANAQDGDVVAGRTFAREACNSQGGECVARDQFEGALSLRVAVVQAKNDLVHDRDHRAAALDPGSLDSGWRERSKRVAIASAQLDR